MAGTNLLALIDDIASLLDDISLYSKLAAKKTAGVLGDDLALNAEQVTGIKADRELPVVWAVAKGAFVNKLILVPVALLISAFVPWLVVLLLMVGGAYLCYEGFEKVFHHFFHQQEAKQQHEALLEANKDAAVDMVTFEKKKIKGAIRTDFILSAEIIVLSLGTVKEAGFMTQVGVLTTIAIGVTVFVYGLVAGIVKLDDAGLHLQGINGENILSKIKRKVGRTILMLAPYLMKTLSFVGTLAMFLVGGGIFTHNIPLIHHAIEDLSLASIQLPVIGMLFSSFVPVISNLLAGLIIGAISVILLKVISQFATLSHIKK